MKRLQLTLLEAILCALVLLVTVSRRGLVSAVAVAPRSSDDDAPDSRLRIGAFNIQVFGVSKLQKEGVLQVLVDVSLFSLANSCFFVVVVHGFGPSWSSMIGVHSKSN